MYIYTHYFIYLIIPISLRYSYFSFTDEESEAQGVCPKPRAWDKKYPMAHLGQKFKPDSKVMLTSKDTVRVQEQTMPVQRVQPLTITDNLLQQFVLASKKMLVNMFSLLQRLRYYLSYLPLAGNENSNPPSLP